MFQLKVSDIGAALVAADHTVLQGATKAELKQKVHDYLSTTYPAKWAKLDHDEKEKLKHRIGKVVDER
ncbi:MAG: hypothetical protein ABMB14_14490 [Myxococcota bacterium]